MIQSCFENNAVFHIASAIGALHEHIMKKPSAGEKDDGSGLAFALRQCNRSINLLTDSANKVSGLYSDPGISLITCVLFAVFESLIGHPTQAIVHALQGRKLLQNCERLVTIGRGSRIVTADAVLPVIGGLEIQAKALQGREMILSDVTDDPPLPDVSRLHSLQHANWTLHNAYIRLLVFCQDSQLDAIPDAHRARVTEKQLLFHPWLEAWEKAFADFLFREAASLTKEDMQRARVLKANHICSIMLVAAAHGDPEAWKAFDESSRAIIDLSASILNSFSIVLGPSLSNIHFPFLSFGLWIVEPLYVVMSRCHDPELRRQAAGLLTGQRPTNITRPVARGTRRGMTPPRVIPNDPADTDAWDIDRWIDWSRAVRLDTGMATYFGRLPSKYIDQPQYPATAATP